MTRYILIVFNQRLETELGRYKFISDAMSMMDKESAVYRDSYDGVRVCDSEYGNNVVYETKFVRVQNG